MLLYIMQPSQSSLDVKSEFGRLHRSSKWPNTIEVYKIIILKYLFILK